MGLFRDTARTVAEAVRPNSRTMTVPTYAGQAGIGSNGSFMSFAQQGYAKNEIVFSAIELLATSAAEPHIIGRRWRRASPSMKPQQAQMAVIEHDRYLAGMGIPNRAGLKTRNAILVRNGFVVEVFDHPLIKILNNPNPMMSRGQLWSTVVMDLKLAGNAYLLKARYQGGILDGAVGELWRLRPDRVRVRVENGQFTGYDYIVGQDKQFFPREDIIHFKTRNPFDDYYGMPPLMAFSQRIDIDNYMRGFLKTFFERGGTGPGSVLAIDGDMAGDDKDETRERFERQFGGNGGWHRMLILDNAKNVTWTQLGLNRGLRDALPKEIDAVNEARLAMAFGIPGSILGLLIGYESSSYANKRQDWQTLWDITMTPLLSDLDDVLNLSLVPEFSGIDEVMFDLSDIRALQEDEDKMHARARSNVGSGLWTWEEGRIVTGMDPETNEGRLLIPGNMVVTPVPDFGKAPPEPSTPGGLMARAMAMIADSEPRHPRVEDDPGARAVYDEAMGLRGRNPGMTWEQIASRVNVAERTLRKYRAIFDDD